MARPKGGGKTPGSGRQKGTKNKVPVVIRDLVVEALHAYENGEYQGARGFLAKLMLDEPKAYSQLIGKMIPTAIESADGNGIPLVVVRDYRGKEGEE